MVGLTATMMVAEIAGGTLFGSMALLADGWHMSTHAGALAIAAFAYRFARRHQDDPRFAFGTGKLGELAGFASAVLLALIALLIAYESLVRVFQPVPIHYAEATAIAAEPTAHIDWLPPPQRSWCDRRSRMPSDCATTAACAESPTR